MIEAKGASAERRFSEQMAAEGWSVSKQGWPDFILEKGGKVALVEVKSGRHVPLSAAQRRVTGMLAAAGFSVYRWDPDDKLQPVEAEGGAIGKGKPERQSAPVARRPHHGDAPRRWQPECEADLAPVWLHEVPLPPGEGTRPCLS